MSATTETIGSYVLESELGRGAFGVVYKAHHKEQPDTPLAVKVIDDRGQLDRLLLEPALLSRLDHPCIVRVEDYFARDGKLVIALEYVPGEDLKTALDRGETFHPEQVRQLLLQIGGALAEAHGKQVMHRDLKPANILLDRRDGQPRFVLTDFGIGREDEGIQAEKRAGGTYFFMAPEQLRGRPCPQSDLWALGVVAYRMLTGKLPFPGPTLPELSRQIQFAAPAAPSQLCPEPIDPDLERAVMQLLDKSLIERTDSAAALLQQLGYKGDSKRVLQDSTLTKPAGSRAEQRQETLDRQLSRRIRSRSIWMWVCVVLYVLPGGFMGSGTQLLGIALFYFAQASRKLRFWGSVGLSFAAYAVFVLRLILPVTVEAQMAARIFNWIGSFLYPAIAWLYLPPEVYMSLGSVLIMVLYLYLPVKGSSYFAEMRRLQREQALHRLSLQGDSGSKEYLDAMEAMLDGRFEDVGFHLKYAEELAAHGDFRRAAVEARLLLVQDPYHFNGNLLLANCYLSLGLFDDCAKVCDEYLDVAGYCFEFDELKQQCQSRRGVA